MTGPTLTGDVVVTARSYSGGSVDVESQLTAAGLRVLRAPADHDLATLAGPLSGAVAWIAGTGPVGPEHLAAAPQLKIVARYGVGVDAVDLAAAAARGVLVTNTPGANSTAVAEHALALLLAGMRHVVRDDRHLRAGDTSVTRARELTGMRVGIVGFGRIGRALAARLQALGVQVLASDPWLSDDDVRAAGAEPADLAGLTGCDALSLHAPGGAVVVDADLLERLRPDCIVVNTARAALVDAAAVAAALRAGRLGCYATDDLGPEPEGGQPLLAADVADRVIATPHSAAQTVEAVDNMGTGSTQAVLDALAGRTPANRVPVPHT
ncbi:C-terminal binding protein [Modestobacter sp. L9-4]|uniref:NAD(P)-dependent oxidoreductase n=1 Tax=Modestobacter sp. L9-4 TaxID=2851567 RepID=UPI001C778E89|nr:NAD(P)-dependent oxidoreductase [Modestobacter sp. L9-4]QXG75011.1 C-terminal binding protein [Modestobacter sp. L9-4]